MVWGADLLVTATALTLISILGTGGAMWAYAAMNVLAFFTLRDVVSKRSRISCAGASFTLDHLTKL